MVKHMRLLFALAAVLSLVAALACTSEVVKEVEVPGETVVVEREVIKEVAVPGETVVVEKEVIKEVVREVPGETVVVEKEVIREVEVPGETVVVEKEVIKEVKVPGETVVVEKEVIKEVKVEVVVEKEVVKIVEVEKPIIVEREVKVVTEVTRGEKVARLRFCCTVNSFTPHLTGSGSPDGLFNLIGVHLVRSDPIQRKQVPDLAERWEIAEDFSSVTYYLRRGAKWHDGMPITARDVEFSYKLWLDPTSIFANLFFGLKGGEEFSQDFDNWKTNELPGVVVVDDHTVRFEFTGPNRSLIELMHGGQTRWTMLPEHILGDVSTDGTRTSSYYQDDLTQGGPFKLVRHVPQQFIELEANDDYWFGRPILDRIILVNIQDRDAAEVAAHRGEVDMMYRGGLSGADAYQGLLLNPDWAMAHIIGGGTIGYHFSKSVDAPLKDKRFRQAMAYAFDRQRILDAVLKGRGVASPLDIALSPYARPEWLEMYRYNPEKSRELLAEMNWDSDREVEVIVTNPDVLAQAMMPIEQQMLSDVGIKIKFNVMERASHVDAMKKFEYEVNRGCGILPGAGTGSPAATLRMEWHSDGRDLTGFAADQGPEWDAKIEALVEAVTDEEITPIFREIGDQLMEELPCLGILNQARYYPIAKRLRVPAYEAIGVYDSTATNLKDSVRYVPYWRQYDHQMFAPERWDIVE